MLILSIDSGIEKNGYAIFEKKGNKQKYIKSGLITTSKYDSTEKRILEIYKAFNNLFKKFKIKIIIIEQLFFFKNQKSVIKVSQAQGVILLIAAQQKVDIVFLTPLQIKQSITGYGQADKKSIQKMLNIILKLKKPLKQDDEADAIACGLAYCYQNTKLISSNS